MGLMECQLEKDKKAGRNAMEGHFEEKEKEKKNATKMECMLEMEHTHKHTGPFWLMECKLKKDQKLWA